MNENLVEKEKEGWVAFIAFSSLILAIGLGVVGAYLFQWIIKVFVWDGSIL